MKKQEKKPHNKQSQQQFRNIIERYVIHRINNYCSNKMTISSCVTIQQIMCEYLYSLLDTEENVFLNQKQTPKPACVNQRANEETTTSSFKEGSDGTSCTNIGTISHESSDFISLNANNDSVGSEDSISTNKPTKQNKGPFANFFSPCVSPQYQPNVALPSFNRLVSDPNESHESKEAKEVNEKQMANKPNPPPQASNQRPSITPFKPSVEVRRIRLSEVMGKSDIEQQFESYKPKKLKKVIRSNNVIDFTTDSTDKTDKTAKGNDDLGLK